MKRALRRIRKLFSALKMAWKDEDWDYAYLLEWMEWKIRHMEKEIRENDFLECTDRACREMRYACALLKRIRADDYISDRHAVLLQQWWETQKVIEKDNRIVMHGVTDTRLRKALDREQAKARKREEQDWDMLFQILHKHMRKWWD